MSSGSASASVEEFIEVSFRTMLRKAHCLTPNLSLITISDPECRTVRINVYILEIEA